MKKRRNMAVLAALVLGSSTAAFAADPVNLTTSVEVVGADYCGIDVSPAGQNSWSLNWTLANAGDASGTLALADGSGTDPLFVNVMVQPGSSSACNLSGMTFGASLPTATHVDDGGKGAFKVATPLGGYWRYMPVVARLDAFTDAAGATNGKGEIARDKIMVLDGMSTPYDQSLSAVQAAQTDVSGVADFGTQSAMALTDNYLATNGVVPLSTGGNGNALSFSAGTGNTVRSVKIGVGALVAKNPEGEDGQVKTDAIGNNGVISLPFTVNVDNP